MTAKIIVGYVGKPIKDGMATDSLSRRELTTFDGVVLGTCFLSKGWSMPRSFTGSTMYQIYARINGRDYTGRGFGENMSVVLRETAESKRQHLTTD